jgi:hypothetical protein
VYELSNDGSKHFEVSFHDGQHFLGSTLVLRMHLKTPQVSKLSLDGLQFFPSSVVRRLVQIFLERGLVLIIVEDRLDHRWAVKLADFVDQLKLFLLRQPDSRP